MRQSWNHVEPHEAIHLLLAHFRDNRLVVSGVRERTDARVLGSMQPQDLAAATRESAEVGICGVDRFREFHDAVFPHTRIQCIEVEQAEIRVTSDKVLNELVCSRGMVCIRAVPYW